MNYENLPRKAIWLDCDPGVDDMIAIMLAAHNPSLNLLGISTVSGNSLMENVNKNALDILNISGFQEIPVFQGSSEPICRKGFVSTVNGNKGLGLIGGDGAAVRGDDDRGQGADGHGQCGRVGQ